MSAIMKATDRHTCLCGSCISGAVRFKSVFESKKVIEYEKKPSNTKKRINKRVFALINAYFSI